MHVPDPAFLREQLDAVSDDVEVDAVKTGMLGTAAVVRTVTAGSGSTGRRSSWSTR